MTRAWQLIASNQAHGPSCTVRPRCPSNHCLSVFFVSLCAVVGPEGSLRSALALANLELHSISGLNKLKRYGWGDLVKTHGSIT